jgi:hypothetical protein
MSRFRALLLSLVALCGVGLIPVADGLVSSPVGASGSTGTTYTPGPASLATITNGSSAAPWNEAQGDLGSPSYTSQSPGTLLPYTPGGATTGAGASAEPNVAVYPGAGSGTDGVSPYPSGTVGTPGPLDGYCGSGNNTIESGGSPVRQPAGTTLPFAPAYFPQIVRNADGSLTGYFDYRPKDADEAIVVANSTDNGQDWTYEGEALEENPGYCPSADINDDGEGHPNVIAVGGVSRLYTLQRPAGDNAGVGMLVHTVNPSAANPVAGVPAIEKVGIDPDAFATSTVSVAATGGSAVSIPLSQTGAAGSPEQLLPGEFVDLTATPVPTAASVITCTGVTNSALTGCTGAAASTVNAQDLIEQVIGTAGAAATIPAGPNKTTGDAGLASLAVNFVNQVTASIFNANAPNRAYVDGVAVYCSQSNASPTTKIEDCTTGPGGSALTVAAGDPVTSDPIIPATAQSTNGLVAPDGIVGVLPSYPSTPGSVPAGATYVAYTEKILNYYVAGVATAGKTKFNASTTINFFPSPTTAQVLPATGSFTVEMGDLTLASASTVQDVFVPVTCTGWSTTTTLNSGQPTDNLTGCTVPSQFANDQFDKNAWIAAPGAATVPGTTLALTGEGSASNAQKLFKNNEDLTVLRVAYTTDGINFSSAGLANNGIISGASNGASTYSDISNPTSDTSPSNLNAFATPGTADATEMRFVGSAGSIITNPDGSYGMFLSGAWAADGDSDAFNQIFYTTSTDGENWSIPVSVVSTDYTFSASEKQDAALSGGTDQALGISGYYSGRAYGPSVVQNPNGTLTMVFAGYRLPKPIESAGTVLGTGSPQYTVGATDPALYRNILVLTLKSSTAQAVTTQTSLTSNNASPAVGQPVTYTATVAPVAPGTGTPTGSVTVAGSAGTLCTATLDQESPDQATCSATYSGPGSDSVSATYTGDSNYASSSSNSVAESIAQDQTSTSFTASTTSPVVGQSVTFTATVAVTAPGSGTATGTVTFAGDSGTLCAGALNEESPNQASCSTTYSSPTNDSVVATYNGDANDAGSASSATPVVAAADPTTTVLATSDLTPVVGEPVTYTATVAASAPGSGTPTGAVTFTGDAGTLCKSVTVNAASPDVANCTVTYTSPGADSVSASYAGDGNYLSSTSGTTSETIAMAQTTTAVSSAPTSPVVGQSVTYTATVAPVSPGAGTPTGTVTFTGSAGTLCATALNQAALDQATCTTTYTSAQHDSVTAAYGGDTNFASSQSATLTESITAATTSTSLSVDNSTPVVGQNVTFTATVKVNSPGSSTPTGTVTFSGNAGVLCTATLPSSSPFTATCVTAYPAAGTDSVTATYNGDPNDTASTSAAVGISISQAATSTSVATSDSSPVVGEVVTFTATVSPKAPGGGTPTGTVTISGAAGTLCTAALNDQSPDQATCTSSYPHVGTDSVTAVYAGDLNFTGSRSSAEGETISEAQTTTSLSAGVTSFVVGQQITFTADVDTVAPGGGTPSGAVTFTQKGGTLCTASLSDTTPDLATCTTSYAKTGSHIVTATYIGSADYGGSASDPFDVPVGSASTTTTVAAAPTPSVTGQSVTLTATVAAVGSSATPAGKVLFTVESAGDESVNCSGGNSKALSGSTATCTIPGSRLLASGSPLDVLASYDGDSSFQPSTASITQVVKLASTTLAVSSSRFPSNPGQAVTFTAAVTPVAPGSGNPGGTVTFSFAPKSLACVSGNSVPLSKGGSATCKIPKGVIASTVTVTANYAGSGDYAASTGSLVQNVS